MKILFILFIVFIISCNPPNGNVTPNGNTIPSDCVSVTYTVTGSGYDTSGQYNIVIEYDDSERLATGSMLQIEKTTYIKLLPWTITTSIPKTSEKADLHVRYESYQESNNINAKIQFNDKIATSTGFGELWLYLPIKDNIRNIK